MGEGRRRGRVLEFGKRESRTWPISSLGRSYPVRPEQDARRDHVATVPFMRALWVRKHGPVVIFAHKGHSRSGVASRHTRPGHIARFYLRRGTCQTTLRPELQQAWTQSRLTLDLFRLFLTMIGTVADSVTSFVRRSAFTRRSGHQNDLGAPGGKRHLPRRAYFVDRPAGIVVHGACCSAVRDAKTAKIKRGTKE